MSAKVGKWKRARRSAPPLAAWVLQVVLEWVMGSDARVIAL